MSRIIKIDPGKFLLTVVDNGYELCRFPIATARYNWQPKYWSNDYRNPSGSYKISSIHRTGSELLDRMNNHHIPWYLSPVAEDPYQDAGTGVYGTAMIVINYPNRNDLRRYEQAKDCGKLLTLWHHFCENHLRPIYDYVSRSQKIPFPEVKIETDYGNRSYSELWESFAIQDPAVAFQLGVAIHGTNDPPCIGTSISAGCIRMHNNDINNLLTMIAVDTEVVFTENDFFSM